MISGRVQGVGFRWFVQRKGEGLGLDGWVRNLPDGRVEVAAIGAQPATDALEEALLVGPRLARVDSVETHEYQHEVRHSKGFHII